MAKGIIYIMTTVVPGLIKIGKTGSENYKSRMYNLEHNGYRNVTGLKRAFAIEVDDYSEKENMLHTIFEKSQVGDTELFALDINIAIQLLSSFNGKVVYPKLETQDEIFKDATEKSKSKLIPDGTYTLKRKKISDNRMIMATATIKDGVWTLLSGSILGITEDSGCSEKVRFFRATIPIDENGQLLEDVELGVCSPSFAGCIVMNQSNSGWGSWRDERGNYIDIYRKNKNDLDINKEDNYE